MICPDIPYVYIDYVYVNIRGDEFQIDNMKFIKIFSGEHFRRVEDYLKEGNLNAHYFYSILDTLNISINEINIRPMQTIEKSRKSMLKKINKLGLNLDKFVFISPEANSCEYLENSYWKGLIKNLQKEGYDIFVNMLSDKVDLSDLNYKSCKLTYSEAYELVKFAKKVYSLRSGFTEFLLDTKVPMEVYYTKFRNNTITAELIQSGFGMSRIPGVDMSIIDEIVINQICLFV